MGKVVKPLSPSEVIKVRGESIPDFVIEAVNVLLVKECINGNASIMQDDILRLAIQNNKRNGNKPISRDKIIENDWLDFESIYESEGWIVRYEKPDFNDPSDRAYFSFKSSGTKRR